MNNPQCHFFDSWPYDDALAFMHAAMADVKKFPSRIYIGCGSHREEIITRGRHIERQGAIFAPPHVLIRTLDRGGGITAHQPGQIVLYPIFKCSGFGITIPALIAILEEAMLDLLREMGIDGHTDPKGPGVFVNDQKLGFIGLRIKNGIVQHGLALNVFNDAAIFRSFDPCGIKDLAITSACHLISLPHSLPHYQKRLVYFFLRNLAERIKTGTSFDVGVLLSSATDSSGTSTLASGK